MTRKEEIWSHSHARPASSQVPTQYALVRQWQIETDRNTADRNTRAHTNARARVCVADRNTRAHTHERARATSYTFSTGTEDRGNKHHASGKAGGSRDSETLQKSRDAEQGCSEDMDNLKRSKKLAAALMKRNFRFKWGEMVMDKIGREEDVRAEIAGFQEKVFDEAKRLFGDNNAWQGRVEVKRALMCALGAWAGTEVDGCSNAVDHTIQAASDKEKVLAQLYSKQLAQELMPFHLQPDKWYIGKFNIKEPYTYGMKRGYSTVCVWEKLCMIAIPGAYIHFYIVISGYGWIYPRQSCFKAGASIHNPTVSYSQVFFIFV